MHKVMLHRDVVNAAMTILGEHFTQAQLNKSSIGWIQMLKFLGQHRLCGSYATKYHPLHFLLSFLLFNIFGH